MYSSKLGRKDTEGTVILSRKNGIPEIKEYQKEEIKVPKMLETDTFGASKVFIKAMHATPMRKDEEIKVAVALIQAAMDILKK